MTLQIYSVSRGFPTEQRFGLTSQLRRAAMSVPSNLAEGCGRQSEIELARFCDIALGSLCEIDYQVFLAYELSYIPTETFELFEDEIRQIRQMLIRFIHVVRNRAEKPSNVEEASVGYDVKFAAETSTETMTNTLADPILSHRSNLTPQT